MSWQSYVDTNLIGTGKVSQACILGREQNGGVWATSTGLTLSPAEQNAIRDKLDPKKEADALTQGVTLAGVKYFGLQAEKGVHIYGKKGQDGCVIAMTGLGILVAIYKSPIQAPECTTVVESLADYLKANGC